MPTYRQILSKANSMTWKNPGLWVFGLFVAILGSGGEFELLKKNISIEKDSGIISGFFSGLFSVPAGTNFADGLATIISNNPGDLVISVLLLLLTLGVSIGLLFLIIASQGALISSVVSAAKNKKLKLSEEFKFGTTKFWPVLGINAIGRFFISILSGVLLSLLTFALLFSNYTWLFVILFIILIPIVIVISFITKYAVMYSVLKNKPFIQSWKDALELFKKNWLVSIEMAFLLFVIFWLLNTVLITVLSLTFIYAIQWYFAFKWAILLLGIALLIMFFISQVFLAVFHWTCWTLVFELLNSQKTIVSRIMSGLQKVFKK